MTEAHVHVADQVWLESAWRFVRDHLPAVPATVLEVGCGPLGGFVPALKSAGYQPLGVDPEAPDGPEYQRVTFEELAVDAVDAVVASTSLHHVADLDQVMGKIASILRSDGRLIVIEWAHERFDEKTARWCFDRLPADDEGWLHHHRDRWLESGEEWTTYVQRWASSERLHHGDEIAATLTVYFEPEFLENDALFFPELEGGIDAERAAIEAGEIEPNGIYFVGTKKR